ncbi:Hypothetical_protein [Hexamita inflata]|uniref:Hypothetical_protein n=1 Tax=Hexamita inflata TaxID=28002 RepID=A0AA86R3W7_9EUKA|nr:Hypothetical protein HINF_LOCUS53034 [Hexamita inflata]
MVKGMLSRSLQNWKAVTALLLPQKRRWYDAGGFPYRQACTKQPRYAPGCLYLSRWLLWLRRCAQRTQVYLKLMIIRVDLQFLYRRPNYYKRKLSEWDTFKSNMFIKTRKIVKICITILVDHLVVNFITTPVKPTHATLSPAIIALAIISCYWQSSKSFPPFLISSPLSSEQNLMCDLNYFQKILTMYSQVCSHAFKIIQSCYIHIHHQKPPKLAQFSSIYQNYFITFLLAQLEACEFNQRIFQLPNRMRRTISALRLILNMMMLIITERCTCKFWHQQRELMCKFLYNFEITYKSHFLTSVRQNQIRLQPYQTLQLQLQTQVSAVSNYCDQALIQYCLDLDLHKSTSTTIFEIMLFENYFESLNTCRVISGSNIFITLEGSRINPSKKQTSSNSSEHQLTTELRESCL